VVQSLDTGVGRVVVEAGTNAQYVPTGHLVYALAGTLLAVPFDAVELTPKGWPVSLVEDMAMSDVGVMAYFAVSNEGTLVYVPSGAQQDRMPVWVDRQRRETSIKGMPSKTYTQLRLSPDGTRIALVAQEKNDDIWIWDLASENLPRLTSGPAWDRDPMWTPDGKSVIFSSGTRGIIGLRNIFRQAADGTGTAEQLTHDAFAIPKALTPDGNGLVFIDSKWARAGAPASGVDRGDVMLLPLVGEQRPQALVRSQFWETQADLSPNGRWLVYQSNESGPQGIFVGPFPNVEARRWLVARGSNPHWARTGHELFYISAGAVMSVPVMTTTPTFTFGKPSKVIDGPYWFASPSPFDASADGQRFLMLKETSAPGDPPRSNRFVVVLNWLEELKQRVPAR
jgi:hypothetical protein